MYSRSRQIVKARSGLYASMAAALCRPWHRGTWSSMTFETAALRIALRMRNALTAPNIAADYLKTSKIDGVGRWCYNCLWRRKGAGAMSEKDRIRLTQFSSKAG